MTPERTSAAPVRPPRTAIDQLLESLLRRDPWWTEVPRLLDLGADVKVVRDGRGMSPQMRELRALFGRARSEIEGYWTLPTVDEVEPLGEPAVGRRLSTADAGAIVDRSARTIGRACDAGRLRAQKVGQSWLLEEDEFRCDAAQLGWLVSAGGHADSHPGVDGGRSAA